MTKNYKKVQKDLLKIIKIKHLQKYLFIDKLKLCDKIVEVLVTGVDMRFCPYRHQAVEMVDINMDKYSGKEIKIMSFYHSSELRTTQI